MVTHTFWTGFTNLEGLARLFFPPRACVEKTSWFTRLVASYIKGLGEAGGIVIDYLWYCQSLNRHRGIVSYLKEHGPLSLERSWAESSLCHLGYVKYKATLEYRVNYAGVYSCTLCYQDKAKA